VPLDYQLRVGQLTQDTEIPEGYELREQRLEETEVGEGTALTLINMKRPDEWTETTNPADCAGWLGLNPWGEGLINYWDLFEAVLTAGDLILLVSWRDQESARGYAESFSLRDGARFRRVRVVRDYGMFDRREAPQYYPPAQRSEAPKDE
jgi:hypothetical protein